MNMDALIGSIAEKSAVRMEPSDYVKDGLIYCGHCNTPKQCRISIGGSPRIVGCQCACREREYAAEIKARKDREKRLEIEELRSTGIADRKIREYTFDHAEDCPEIRFAREYCGGWERMYGSNQGLLFWGGVGSGKTFAAGCIANELISRGIPVMVTSFPRILGIDYAKRWETIDAMMRYPLLVIDDLGAERRNEFALETVYTVVDERYKARKPLIVTTNLRLQDMQSPQDTAMARIYDRILEMCAPMLFKGRSRRPAAAKDKMAELKRILKGEGNEQ